MDTRIAKGKGWRAGLGQLFQGKKMYMRAFLNSGRKMQDERRGDKKKKLNMLKRKPFYLVLFRSSLAKHGYKKQPTSTFD